MTGTQKYATVPIEIVAQGTSAVTFSVMQSWLDHPACFVATDYLSTNGQTCERNDNVAPGEIGTYTAICSNGVAQVNIYVHSSAFDTEKDNAEVPERCDPIGEGQAVEYSFDVPCAVEEGSDACAPTPELTCDHFDSQTISSENFEKSGDTQSWLFAVEGSSLGLSADIPEVSKTFEVPVDSSEITLEFDFYESDHWESDDEVYIRINGVYLDLISYTSGTSEGTKTGTFGELSASMMTSGSIHHVELTIPDSWYPDGRLPIGFKVTTSKKHEEAFGFDNIMLSSACESLRQPSPSAQPSGSPSSAPVGAGPGGGPSTAAPFGGPGTSARPSARPSCTRSASASPSARPSCTPTPTQPPQVDDVTCSSAHIEDFEDGQALTWVNGLEATGSGFTTFLGRLGKENPDVTKTFEVPITADTIIVEFDFYSIDGHDADDKVYIGVQGTFLDLNLFVSSTGTTSVLYNDIALTIVDRKTYDVGFDSEMDEKFHIKLEIPKIWYGEGELEIGFRVHMTKSITTNGGGVDNFEISADCSRRVAEKRNTPGLEPSDDAEDGSFYCLSEDFPCQGGNNMVHLCHYSTRRGYQTFCIPEADSEILRFYSNDYCGPCVGGYGGVDAIV
jgi:hypothetical protein